MPPMKALAALCLAFFGYCAAAGQVSSAPVSVFAASSLQSALDDAARLWEAQTGDKVRITYAGTSTLARQIDAGAPAEVFLSASIDWMNWVEEKGLLIAGSRRDLWANRLVLVGSADGGAVTLDAGLGDVLGDGPLAMAQVDTVPAGQYGKAAFESLGLWDALAPRVVEADNVRRALALVALGEAALGVVYATDAAIEPRVAVRAVFPAESHPPIRYPGALTLGASPEAAAFLDFLATPAAQAVFTTAGFTEVTP